MYHRREEEGITAFQCCDSTGLCLKSNGKAVNSASVGYIHNLASRAQLLKPSDSHDSVEQPLILIESDQHKIIIQRQGNTTVAVYKDRKSSNNNNNNNNTNDMTMESDE